MVLTAKVSYGAEAMTKEKLDVTFFHGSRTYLSSVHFNFALFKILPFFSPTMVILRKWG